MAEEEEERERKREPYACVRAAKGKRKRGTNVCLMRIWLIYKVRDTVICFHKCNSVKRCVENAKKKKNCLLPLSNERKRCPSV